MTERYRGHLVYADTANEVWRYHDTREPVYKWVNRPCGHCGLANTREGHDGCLGTLPGVKNACCGHGAVEQAYVQFNDGSDIRGQDALDWVLSN